MANYDGSSGPLDKVNGSEENGNEFPTLQVYLTHNN